MAPSISLTSLKILFILLSCPLVLLVFLLANRKSRLFVAALFIVLTLLLPPSLVVENGDPALNALSQLLLPNRLPYKPLPFWVELLAFAVFLLPFFVLSTGMIMATILLKSGLKLNQERTRSKEAGLLDLPVSRNHDDRFTGATLVLSGLLLAVTFYNFYWTLVLDGTTDSIGFFWLAFSVPVILFCGIYLNSSLQRRARLASLIFTVAILGSLFGSYILAARVDHRALTDARAERVSRAIEAYHARTDRYPESLKELAPRDLLGLPRPVIIAGQDWCYEVNETGYRFGYVDRDHWSSPYLVGRLYQAGGAAESLPELCAVEIAAIRESRGW